MSGPALHGVLRKCLTVTKAKGLQGLIREYVDQHSKPNAISVAQAEGMAGTDAAYRALIENKKAPLRPGKDYVPSPNSDTVRVYGFLTEALREARAPGKEQSLENDLSALSAYWVKHTEDLKKKAYHIVWSISPVLQQKALKYRIPIQELLFSSAVSSLGDYTTWLHSESALGFILGFHADKPNTHLHGLIFPSAQDGTNLNFSRMAPYKAGNNSIRLDCQGYLHRAYLYSLDDVDHAINNAIPREQLPPEKAMGRAFLGNQIQINMADKLAKDSGLPLEVAAARVRPDAFAAMSNPAAMEAARKEGAEQYRQLARTMMEPGASRTAAAQLVQLSKGLVSESSKRRLALRSEMDELVACHDKLAKSPDRVSDIFLCEGGPRLAPGSQIEPIQHLLGGQKPVDVANDPVALIAHHAARKEGVLKAHSGVAEALTKLCAGIDKHRVDGPTHSAKALYFTRSMVDLVAAKRGTVPLYLSSEVALPKNNDFLEKPDNGAAYVRNLLIKDAERHLRRAKPLNIEIDANVVLGPAGSPGAGDQDDEAAELKPPVLSSGLPNSIDIDPSQPLPPSLDSKSEESLQKYRPQLEAMKRRAMDAPDLMP